MQQTHDEHTLSVAKPARHPVRAFLRSFVYAFAGIGHLFRSQRNARVHAFITTIALSLGVGFGVSRLEWIALVLTIMVVLVAEAVNTAVEAVVDLASPLQHPLARIAKDTAAGAVLLAAIGAVVVGCLVFLERVWRLALALVG